MLAEKKFQHWIQILPEPFVLHVFFDSHQQSIRDKTENCNVQ